MGRETLVSRRTFGQFLLASPLAAGILAATSPRHHAGAEDIEPIRTPLYGMLEIMPERPGPHGDAFPVTTFANLMPPGTSNSVVKRATILPDAPETGEVSAEWEEYFGFRPEEIRAVTVQDDDTGFLMIIDGHFDNESRENIIATWESNDFILYDKNDTDFSRYIWMGLDNYPSAGLPHLKGLGQGHYAILAMTSNGKVVISSDLELARLVHLAERKQTSYMTFTSGVEAAHRHEPPGVFEAIILPGNRFASRGVMATPVASDGVISGLLGVTVMTQVDHPDWTIIASVDRMNIDDTDSGSLYAEQVESRFALATSTLLGIPYPEIMSFKSVTTEYSTAVFTFSPRVDSPPNIIELARQGDLGFLHT